MKKNQKTKKNSEKKISVSKQEEKTSDTQKNILNLEKDSICSDNNGNDRKNTTTERKNILETNSKKRIKLTEVEENTDYPDEISTKDEPVIYLSPTYTNTEDFEFESTDNQKLFAIPKNRPVRLYCDGVYDLFHYGHMRCLMQAKNLFPNVFLIVGVTNDSLTKFHKGELIMNEKERYESVKHCRYVDQVVEDAPWVITQEFLDKYKIDYVCHDDIPYKSKESADVYDFLKAQNKFVPTRRTVGVSTTDIITKIVRDYDFFVRRQLGRGIAMEELNLPFLKKESLIFQKKWKNLEKDFKKEMLEIKAELKYAFLFWEKVSNRLIKKFNERFTKKIKDESNPFNKFIKKILRIMAKKKINQEIE